MKNTLLCLCMASTFLAAAQHGKDNLEYSVFSTYTQSVNSRVQIVPQEKLQDIFPGWNINTDEISSAFTDAYGDAISVPGNSLNEKVSYFMQNKLQKLGVKKDEWKQTRNTVAPHASYVDFDQYINGRKVIFSNLAFRFTKDNKLVRVKMNSYGSANASAFTILDKAQILKSASITDNIENATISSREIIGDWSWFPVPGTNGYELHPAYEFLVIGEGNNLPLELSGYVDASTGELLYRTNNVTDAIKIKVKADSIYKINRVLPISVEPLANLRITIDTNKFFTNDTGLYENNLLSAPQTMKIALWGKWARVRTQGAATPEFTVQFNNDSNYFFLTNPDSGSSIRHVNAYYHTNKIHDFMKSYFPDFTTLDTSISVNVDMPGSCNAYYVPGKRTLNFFPAGDGCNSFAEIGDVVYHEYGHGISYDFYRSEGKSFTNGALGEGNSDVWGMSITRDSFIARYKDIGDPNSHIRRYDSTPKLLSKDLMGESHNDGEIIAGSWYYIARYSGDWNLMATLFTKTYFDLPNGPNGFEKRVFSDVLISALLNDDDDGNLTNGTPHLALIIRAFAEHHIFVMSGVKLEHEEVPHQQANTPTPISVGLTVTATTFLKDVQLVYRVRGASNWSSITMEDANNDLIYTGNLPAFPSNNIVDYFFKVRDILTEYGPEFPEGYSSLQPSDKVTLPYQFGCGLKQIIKMDFETDAIGWSIGDNPGDDADGGEWLQAFPKFSKWGADFCQTGKDHTSGEGQCLVTGNSSRTTDPDAADVDKGATTVITSTYDIGAFGFPVIEYYRWYSNDRGYFNAKSDAWEVLIRDTTTSNWVAVDKTYQADYNWRRRVFGVREYLPNAKYIQLKFIARDDVIDSLLFEGQNIVEAAVDDFSIYDLKDLNVAGISNSGISIYPNPTDDQLNITLPSQQTGAINLYDITGRIVAAIQVNTNTTKYTINTSSLAQGQYLLSVKTNGVTEVKKIVISH